MAKKRQETKQPLPDADARLSQAFHICFSTPSGRMVLDHLRAELVNRVMAPSASDAQLRYREGQRSVVGIIDTRMKEAKNG